MAKQFDSVKDHGNARTTFEGGAVREQATGKGRFDLIPPVAIQRLARHYENGASKYGDRNWEGGLPLSRFVDSAYRHLNEFMAGNREEDHLAAILWNVAGYIHTEEQIRLGELSEGLRDVPWPDSVE